MPDICTFDISDIGTFDISVADFDQTIYKGYSFIDVLREKAFFNGKATKAVALGLFYCIKTSMMWSFGFKGRAIAEIDSLHEKLDTTDEELEIIYKKLVPKICNKRVNLVKKLGCKENYIITRSRERDVRGILNAYDSDIEFDGIYGNNGKPNRVPYQNAIDKLKQIEKLSGGRKVIFVTDSLKEAQVVETLPYAKSILATKPHGRLRNLQAL